MDGTAATRGSIAGVTGQLLSCLPAKPTLDVGMSCLLNLGLITPAIVPSCRCCSTHFATSLLTNEVYAPVLNRVSAVKD